LKTVDREVGMTIVVSVLAVVSELEALTEESSAYLNRETGELYSLGDEEAGAVEDAADSDDLPEWLRDEAPKIREVLESGDWLPLPTRFDVDEWAIMDGFALSVDDPELRHELRGAIRGTGAFRHFKDTIHRLGIQESWYRFRDEALAGIAIDWLEEHGITYTRDEGGSPTE
jgi:hypothetical protein